MVSSTSRLHPFAILAESVLVAACLIASVRAADEPAAKAGKGTAEQPAAESDAEARYRIPEGKSQEIFEWVENLQQQQPRFRTRQQYVNHAIRVYRTMALAGEKILGSASSEEDLERAASLRMESLAVLANSDIPGAAEEALKAADVLAADSRKPVSRVGRESRDNLRVALIGSLKPADQEQVISEVLAAVSGDKPHRNAIQRAVSLAQTLETVLVPDRAADFYKKTAAALKKAQSDELDKLSMQLEATARRIELPGKPLQVSGITIEGEKLDWKSYAGKVVLVDFWATWCGPCRAELPNVKRLYQQYHSRGFEVIGISLDEEHEPLQEFLNREQIPWVTLFDGKDPANRGWEQPLARYYGISGIPTAILVGKDGNVVSLEARGDDLEALLVKLIGPADAAGAANPDKNERKK